MAKAAFTLFCFVDTIGIGTTMAPSTVFGHAEYRYVESELKNADRPMLQSCIHSLLDLEVPIRAAS